MEGVDLLTSGGSGGVIAGVVALFHKFMADRKMEQMNQRITDSELFVARNYVTQDALKNALAPVMDALDRMESKIDHLSEKKADKP